MTDANDIEVYITKKSSVDGLEYKIEKDMKLPKSAFFGRKIPLRVYHYSTNSVLRVAMGSLREAYTTSWTNGSMHVFTYRRNPAFIYQQLWSSYGNTYNVKWNQQTTSPKMLSYDATYEKKGITKRMICVGKPWVVLETYNAKGQRYTHPISETVRLLRVCEA